MHSYFYIEWARCHCAPFRNRICVHGGSHSECAVLTVAASTGSDPIRHVTEVTYGVGVHGNHSECMVESSWNVMAHGGAWEGKWRGNRRMEWVASTLHTTSEHGVSSITTADAHTSAVSSRLNWCPHQIKWTRPFRQKAKPGFCTCAITFQVQSTSCQSRHWKWPTSACDRGYIRHLKCFMLCDFPMPCTVQHPSCSGAPGLFAHCVL